MMGLDIEQSIGCMVKSLRQTATREISVFGSPSLDLCIDQTVAAVLGESPTLSRFIIPAKCHTYVGWGRKSGALAEKLARFHDKNLIFLEDGFLRSYDRNDPSMSIIVDDMGIYYDASRPSRLEELIKRPVPKAEGERLCAVLQHWRRCELSKYNAGSEYQGDLPEDYVLVVDQVRYDASVRFGLADDQAFQSMLAKAVRDNPERQVIVKIHPDIYTKSKLGHYDVNELGNMPNVIVVAQKCLPTRLIRNAAKVYTVTSQIGFEALIWDKPVCCMGMPFYAGWGLTEDVLPAPDRRSAATFEQLAYAALIAYPRYVDPAKGAVCDIESVMEILANQKATGNHG